MIEWQPVATLPEKGKYLGWSNGRVVYGEPFTYRKRDCLIDGASGKWWQIRHWAEANPPEGASDAR
jgi:hypothetical protein